MAYRTPAVYVAPPVATVAVVEQPAYVPPPDYAAPPMVEVDGNPGVEVITDYDYPVFYSGGLYWRNDGGIWMSSRYHTGGWYRNEGVPVGVRGISRPEVYAHYRAPIGAVRVEAREGGRVEPIRGGGEVRVEGRTGGEPIRGGGEVRVEGRTNVEPVRGGGEVRVEGRTEPVRGGGEVHVEGRTEPVRPSEPGRTPEPARPANHVENVRNQPMTPSVQHAVAKPAPAPVHRAPPPPAKKK